MFRKEVAARPLLIWLLCAMAAPVVQKLAGSDPLLLGLISAACIAVVCMGLAGDAQYGKVLSTLQFLWTGVAVGVLAQYAADSWPMGNGDTVVALVLLAIAAWSSGKGAVVAARTAGILFVLLCVGYGLILSAGITQIDQEWVTNRTPGNWKQMAFIMLIPGAAACLPRKTVGKRGLSLFMIPAFAILIAWITCGNIHPKAKTESFAFYEMCRSLSFFGITERFEALACALVSISWFSLLSLLLSCTGTNAQRVCPGKGAQGVWLTAGIAAVMVLGKISISDALLCGIGGIFWGLIPILAQSIEIRKKCRKK